MHGFRANRQQFTRNADATEVSCSRSRGSESAIWSWDERLGQELLVHGVARAIVDVDALRDRDTSERAEPNEGDGKHEAQRFPHPVKSRHVDTSLGVGAGRTKSYNRANPFYFVGLAISERKYTAPASRTKVAVSCFSVASAAAASPALRCATARS